MNKLPVKQGERRLLFEVSHFVRIIAIRRFYSAEPECLAWNLYLEHCKADALGETSWRPVGEPLVIVPEFDAEDGTFLEFSISEIGEDDKPKSKEILDLICMRDALTNMILAYAIPDELRRSKAMESP